VTRARRRLGRALVSDDGLTRLLARLPSWLVDEVPRDHRESDAAFRRRRRVTAGVSVAGAGLLGVSLSQRPDSRSFYALTLGVAGTWAGGGLASGPLHLGWVQTPAATLRRPLLTPVLAGAGAFGLFYAAALVARRIPPLDAAVARVLRYAHQGSAPLVLTTTLANGIAEEVFFRGALYAAVGVDRPVLKSSAVYTLATVATRNPALVLASVPMGLLFALQRRVTGGIQAPALSHVTWSVLMLRFLPPLFADRPSIDVPRPAEAPRRG
jgi:membrane protease YdiL (CAAX protease family)